MPTADQQLELLFSQIQTVLAGHSETMVMQALLKSLVVTVGVGAPSLPRAEALLDALPEELKPILRHEWINFRRHRAKATTAPSSRMPDAAMPN